jgi:galactose-1-phosphate uridylyltransferase
MADGTVKQTNPFSGTEVWSVPGRGNRPLGVVVAEPGPLSADAVDTACPFCSRRYLDTPPEKARLVRIGDEYQTLYQLRFEQLFETVAEFRRVADLFEILPLAYWQANRDYQLTDAAQSHKHAYLSTDAGRRHVLAVLATRLAAAGKNRAAIDRIPVDERLSMANAFFGGGHEIIIARRHFVDGARFDNQLAASGTLTADEHDRYFRFTIDALREVYRNNRYVRFVAVFQNWLEPAGASVDHLHKHLVAIDDRGVQNEYEIRLARANPNIFNDAAVNFAARSGLVFAENDHAVAFAGFGHRFPTLEVYSKSRASEPWNHDEAELKAVSDLIHACHAAMGPNIPCNEEWHYKPPDADVPMPWRVMIKWRISTPAGFEGGTSIYINTIDPESLRARVLPKLFELREAGWIGSMRIGDECRTEPNCLQYNAWPD